jgi:hypothetical protein
MEAVIGKAFLKHPVGVRNGCVIVDIDLAPLLTYFQNRDVWVFEPDEDNSSVPPYSPQNTLQ